jgi:hypothetical protein
MGRELVMTVATGSVMDMNWIRRDWEKFWISAYSGGLGMPGHPNYHRKARLRDSLL